MKKYTLLLSILLLMTACSSHELTPLKTFTDCAWNDGTRKYRTNDCSSIKFKDFDSFFVAPNYPEKAKENKISGKVKVLACFDKNGDISRRKIIKSEPKNIFDASVLSALDKWNVKRIDNKKIQKPFCISTEIKMTPPKKK